jgi:hypothetical protein
VTTRQIFEQRLACWQEGQRQLAGELLGDRHGRDDELAEERADWLAQWDQANVVDRTGS